MTQEKDTSEQPKSPRQRSVRGARRVAPEEGEESGVTTSAKPRRRTIRAASGDTGADAAPPAADAFTPEADAPQSVARARRTRVSHTGTGESAPAEDSAAAAGENAELPSPRKPRHRTAQAAEAALSVQADTAAPSEAAAQT